MNELREKIEYYVLKYGNDRVEFHGQNVDRENVVNAILDAVIAALPSKLEITSDREGIDYHAMGQNHMLSRVKDALQLAKEERQNAKG